MLCYLAVLDSATLATGSRDGHTNVVGHDALDFPDNIRDKNPGLTAGKFDLVLTNPPFGATIRRTEKGDGYLEQFELMRYLSKDYPLHTDMTGAGENYQIPVAQAFSNCRGNRRRRFS